MQSVDVGASSLIAVLTSPLCDAVTLSDTHSLVNCLSGMSHSRPIMTKFPLHFVTSHSV